ncbi:MAG: HNH endonuclease [Planctomycetota bacterium]
MTTPQILAPRPNPRRPAPKRLPTCHDCAFCLTNPGLWLATLPSGFPVAGMCANHSDAPGRWRQIPVGRPCRNFRPKPGSGRVEPPQPPDDKIRYIPLTRGLHAIVDAKNYEWLSRHKWSVHDTGPGKAQYAVRGCRGRKIFMHREIMKTPPGMVVDHINRNGLDNREDNLRNCTRLQNLQNRYWNAGQSQYRGVSPQGDKWMAAIGYNGATIYVGLFDDEVEAARARDRKAYELASDFAYLNFPDEIERQHGL